MANETTQAGQSPSYLTVRQTADMLNITERQVRNLITKRLIPHTKIGGLIRFNYKELEKWAMSNTRPMQTGR
jgi:excisionase family DNA binding protein